MKRQIAMIALLFLGMGMTASAQFGKKFNVGKALQAGKDVVSAVTLSDADIANMSKDYMVWMDAHNPLTKPDTEYGKRLEKLTGHIKEMDGLKLNFGVYEVVDVNAFACGDGSVRICAGLMDVMTDEEVMAVVGHEIGHVVHTDSKDAMKNAYLRSAVKNAAGAASNKVAKLTDSELGAMAEALAGAQYSQKQENEADEYGVEFCVKNNIEPSCLVTISSSSVSSSSRMSPKILSVRSCSVIIPSVLPYSLTTTPNLFLFFLNSSKTLFAYKLSGIKRGGRAISRRLNSF
jgi:metalloprotease